MQSTSRPKCRTQRPQAAAMSTTAGSEWAWKAEPESPVGVGWLNEEEDWLAGDDGAALFELAAEEVGGVGGGVEGGMQDKQARAIAATRLLQQLDQWVKEEPFPDWFEEKVDLPIFEELPGLIGGGNANCGGIASLKPLSPPPGVVPLLPVKPPPPPPTIPLVEPTSTLLQIQEFEYVLTRHDALTPPQSPREEEVLTMLQEMQAHELDELVRMRVESLVKSPQSSSGSSFHDEDMYSPASASASDSGYDDPEWNSIGAATATTATPVKRRRAKPYSSTPPEEKRMRKKEQNKNAATRYRLKKKAEIDEILGEEKGLLEKNEKLKGDLTELTREIKYLKNLMRDVYRAKGLIRS